MSERGAITLVDGSGRRRSVIEPAIEEDGSDLIGDVLALDAALDTGVAVDRIDEKRDVDGVSGSSISTPPTEDSSSYTGLEKVVVVFVAVVGS